ncbi:MAG: histidine-type phosphatase [Prevotella sp.]|nr:histidine-type phosphatase [Prevotella sp.]
MKKLYVLIITLACTLYVQAQTARDDFRRDTHYSASNYLAYPAPTQTELTPAPEGKKPFYISHYGRHGSRYLINKDEYNQPYEILTAADKAGKLTPLGQDVLRRVTLLRDEAAGRLGELTPLGAQQHRDIARRMFERFPEVFEGKANIDAKSTVVIRCILSMENELMQLTNMNPLLHVLHDASQHDMWYMNLTDKSLFEQRYSVEAQAAYYNFMEKHRDYKRAMGALFNDEDYMDTQLDVWKLNNYLFKLASNLQSSELHKQITLYDLFTDDEIYANWAIINARWYIDYAACPLNGARQPYSQRNLLRRIIEEADSCIALPKPGATLRFGHETMVLPLTCLLELDGYGLQTDDLESLDSKGWRAYKIFPMAANLQFIFYRKDAADKDVLVKVLLNENEAQLPISSSTEPYYKWSEVRDYYLKKLEK